MQNEKPIQPVTFLIQRDSTVQDAIRQATGYVVDTCHSLAEEAGWWTDLETGEDVRTWVLSKVALMHTELSEGVEGFRKDLMDDKLPHRKMFEVELADAVIRIFDLAGGLNLDIGGAIVEKLVFNTNREDHNPENRKTENGKRI